MEKYYLGAYGLNNGHYPFRFVINLAEHDKHLSIDLNLNGDKFPLKPIKKDDFGFITSPFVSPDTLQKEEAELLLFVTSIIFKVFSTKQLIVTAKNNCIIQW